MPRFILQPLVENSILHGTADEDDFVTITVRATVSENLLTIHISDTGCGFDPSAIKEKNSERFSGIGLSNVDERMRLHYGNEYGLTIESAPAPAHNVFSVFQMKPFVEVTQCIIYCL